MPKAANSALITSIEATLTTRSRSFMEFDTEAELESYARSNDYRNANQICWALVIVSEASDKYTYKLRFNMSTAS